jgi:hypothetical protein
MRLWLSVTAYNLGNLWPRRRVLSGPDSRMEEKQCAFMASGQAIRAMLMLAGRPKRKFWITASLRTSE